MWIFTRKSELVSVGLVLGLLSACGYAEWPPRDQSLRDVNAPSGASAPASRSTTGNPNAFVGASAVVVGKGDTVYALSKRHRVPMRAIIEANGLEAPFVLHIGQRIVLPRAKTHKIVRGDTLFGIANTYDVNAFELARLNGLKKPYVIHVGNALILPDSAPQSISKPAVTPGKPETLAQSPAASNSSEKKKTAAPSKTQSPPPTPAWVSPPQIKKASVTKTPKPPARKALSKPPAKSSKGFLWPIQGKIISGYGAKSKGLRNDGINIRADRGSPVRAAENGVVAYAGNELRGFGNLLLIKHADGWVTAYAHNDALLVKRGDKIKRGQKIATVGSTGNVSTPQLHFEIRRGNKARDPKKYLRGRA